MTSVDLSLFAQSLLSQWLAVSGDADACIFTFDRAAVENIPKGYYARVRVELEKITVPCHADHRLMKLEGKEYCPLCNMMLKEVNV